MLSNQEQKLKTSGKGNSKDVNNENDVSFTENKNWKCDPPTRRKLILRISEEDGHGGGCRTRLCGM